MLGSDRGGDTVGSGQYEIDGLSGCDMFDHDAQGRKSSDNIAQRLLDEDSFTIENIALTVGDLAMNQ